MALELKHTTSEKESFNWSEFLNKDISFKKGISLKRKQALFNDLFLLINAGLDIKRVLELVTSEQKKKKDKELLNGIYQNVLTGGSLSEALSHSKVFDKYEVYCIKIGEESGRLASVLKHLAHFFEKKIEQKRVVTSALSYPVVVLCIAILAVVFMIGYVVPTFADTYNNFDAELPAITQWLVSFSASFPLYLSLFIGSILAIVFVFVFFKNHDWLRKFKAKFLLNIPFIGKIIRTSWLNQFCLSMHLLTNAKTPLIESLGLVKNMLDFYPLSKALAYTEDQIIKGKSLSKSFSEFSFFPSRMVYLINVGEEVNELEDIFHQLSVLYTKELEHKSKILGSVLEPVLLLFIGALVGFIVVAMYLPMFSLSEVMN